MSETNPFDNLLEQIRVLVQREFSRAAQKPPKLLYTTREAAEMLNVSESWLAAKARAGEIPHRMLGHYRYFSMKDVETIIEQFAIMAK